MLETTKLVINSTFRHLLGVAIILEFRANHRQLGKSWGDLGLNILGNIGHIYICIHIIIYISLSHAFTGPSFALVAPLCHLYRSLGSRTQKSYLTCLLSKPICFPCCAHVPLDFLSRKPIQWRTFFTGKILSKSCSIYSSVLLQSNVTVHVLKEIPHYSRQSIPKCQFPGTYIHCLNMSNLDKNVYVRIQGSKIPRFAQSC